VELQGVLIGWGAWGSVVVKALRDRFSEVSLDFSATYSFRPYHGHGVDSAPSENEYQEHSMGVKAAGAWSWPHHLHVPNVMKSGSLNLLEPSGPHRACYGTPLPFLLIWRRIPEKLIVAQVTNNTLHGTWRCITLFAKDCCTSQLSATWIQLTTNLPTPHPQVHYNVILPHGTFRSRFPNKITSVFPT